ncbi:MAG: hypothetical protein K9G11_00690 [Rickettsiaceae bacterium]|nr:hypothetical protein [Rickettsiaceae bacterium]
MHAQPLVEYVFEESVVLDCHALQARNDTCALPLENVASLCIYVEELFVLDCHATQARLSILLLWFLCELTIIAARALCHKQRAHGTLPYYC